MSQIQKLFDGTVKPDIETVSGDIGGVVSPILGNLNIFGGTGVLVSGNPVTGTLTISDDDLVQGNVTTSNAVPATCINFPLGADAGTYVLEGRITGYNITDIAGGSYFFSCGVRTTGAAALLIATDFGAMHEEAAMETADFNITVAGNSLVVEVLGIVAKIINWSAEFEYQFVGI